MIGSCDSHVILGGRGGRMGRKKEGGKISSVHGPTDGANSHNIGSHVIVM